MKNASISTSALFVYLFILVSVPCVLSKVSQAQVKNPGLFYVFTSGQVILIDAVEKKYVKAITAYESTGVPFPNKCTGSPFNGTWNDNTLGIGKDTIFVTATYLVQPPQRLSNLSDAIYVVDTAKQEIAARVPVLDRPVHVYYIPFENSVWSHNDGVGTFTVIEASPPYSIIEPNTSSPRIVVGHGKLIYDERLVYKGYKTSVTVKGGYVMDLSQPDNSEENVKFLNFTEILTPEQAEACGGTHAVAYSSLSNQVYFGCTPASTDALAPTVAIDASTDKLAKFWNFTSAQLYTTPDQAFVIGVDGKLNIVNILYAGMGDIKHYSIQLKANSTPSQLVVYPKDSYYLVFVSLLNLPEVAVIDFNGVVNCIASSNCTSSDLQAYVNYVYMGYMNPPGAPNSLARYRQIDAGHRFICTLALYENSVFCYDSQTGEVDNYVGLESPQRIVFVEGELNGSVGEGNASTKYDCANAPTTMMKVSKETSGVKSARIGVLLPTLMMLFLPLLMLFG